MNKSKARRQSSVHLLFNFRASQKVGEHLKAIFVPYMVKIVFGHFLLKVNKKGGVRLLYHHHKYIYGMHPRKILWSSYRKLAWVGFEPTTTEFHSDPLIDWAFRWGDEFNLHSEPTLYNYSSFIVCSVSRLILAIAFISRHACFDIYIYIYIYIYIHQI